MSVTLVSVCIHASACVTQVMGGGGMGASEDTGVFVMVGAWEKAGRGGERGGGGLTFDPFHRLGSSQDPSAETGMCLDARCPDARPSLRTRRPSHDVNAERETRASPRRRSDDVSSSNRSLSNNTRL